jgi:methylmalonyl-CoA mutase N-terminal domain/subunit
LEEGRTAVVGENLYPSTGDQPEISVFRYPEGVEENQKRRLAQLRESRDASKAEAALTALERDCKDGRNLLPASVQCARVGCSGGEIWKVFKSAFGTWRPPSLG